MRLQEVQYHNVRNLKDGALDLAPHLTWIYGDNGAGKTSILESIYLLGTGHSFRTNTIDRVISHEQSQFIVFARGQEDGLEHRIGLQRDRNGQMVIRLNGNDVRRLADIAMLLPILAFTPDSYQLLSGSPKERRRYLDWGVFHVEHRFAEVHSRFSKTLRHRNALLRQQASREELNLWTRHLVNESIKLNEFRQQYWQQLAPVIESVLTQLYPNNEVSFGFYPGWTGELEQVMADHLDKDIEAGSTRFGPQRADIRCRIGRVSADEELSRGQNKLVVQSLLLAQIRLFSQLTGRSGVLLLDDIGGELDQGRFESLLNEVLALEHWQVIVSATEIGPKRLLKEYNSAMFHVEHGQVKPVTVDHEQH
ncbi:DNA replication/repair protein RecF [Permianibacter aggregans]|uniref:DNA replication and repair protein RecF n=1 Tax=Permianibacter aggregans TaxID=1510150 RepID=A0A4R6UE27_9GAMM|nr:DNA replication/repair protein RecF [Permianibacter aggregans]QGX39865.1 DNA replication/repair protein RecF [Permianibacter aggregans]TDQ43413.1 DNA replication and repair protein RecF [Permianibacter aggregans]